MVFISYFRVKISTVEKSIQLVSFNVPYPPDYGGVIDVFYKIKALSESGISVYLHCFEYDRPRAKELEKYCAKVFYYQRNKGVRYQLFAKPYIVITRNNDQLLRNLSSVNVPILFEGLHTCYFLGHPELANHFQLVRTHNVEHDYYLNLVKSEPNFFRKIYFRIEAIKLKKYEKVLKKAAHLLCISPNDNFYFHHQYRNSHFIPAFHPFNEIKSKGGRGAYVLFHGNLSVAENIEAVGFLLDRVFNKTDNPVIIAGKNPNDRLRHKIAKFPHIQLVANPEGPQMEKLIQDAQICMLPTFQDTGLKLKLLASLFSGRFCIANSPMVHKTGLEHLCHLADTPNEMVAKINELFDQDFLPGEIERRKLILEDIFSNRLNALKIIRLLD